MKKIFLYLVLLVSGSIPVLSQQYTMASVPDIVKNKADVVTHLEETIYQIENLERAIERVHRVYTVLNEDGKQELFFNQYSTKFMSLEDVDIRVYDANGRQTGKYRKKDMTTVAVGEGLIDDGYVTYFPIPSTAYPVTVDIKYEVKLKTTLIVPSFRFSREKEGIVKASYAIWAPNGVGLRFKAVNTTLKPEITDDGKSKLYKWTVDNFPPPQTEEGTGARGAYAPHVKFATDRFAHYGYEGEMSSWDKFGSWISNLYRGLEKLPDNRQQFFANLVKDVPDEKEKIRRIYEYMQKNFRYVSIQLGIGGLRPFSADFTDQKKYGDCKALSNYMKAALLSVGIPSHIAIINAGSDGAPVDADFPSNEYFNHAILCVPGKKDSVWLECTSSTAEFGQLGTFTENRNALLITETGGVLVPTPKSMASSNSFFSTTVVTLENDLSGVVETRLSPRGYYRESLDAVLKEKKDRQKEYLVFALGFRQPDDFAFERIPAGQVNLKMAFSKIPEFNAGNKLFISPRMNKLSVTKLPGSETRTQDFYFRFPFIKQDTTIYRLPAGAKPEIASKEKELKCDFASYVYKCWYNESENAVYSTTSLELKQHRIPAASYSSVKKFFDDLATEESQRIVVQKSGDVKTDPQKKAF